MSLTFETNKSLGKERLLAIEALGVQNFLPKDLVILFMSFLPSFSVCQSQRVCKQWQILGSSECIWKILVSKDFPNQIKKNASESFKDFYRSQYLEKLIKIIRWIHVYHICPLETTEEMIFSEVASLPDKGNRLYRLATTNPEIEKKMLALFSSYTNKSFIYPKYGQVKNFKNLSWALDRSMPGIKSLIQYAELKQIEYLLALSCSPKDHCWREKMLKELSYLEEGGKKLLNELRKIGWQGENYYFLSFNRPTFTFDHFGLPSLMLLKLALKNYRQSFFESKANSELYS